MVHPVGAFLHMPDHPAPAAQREQRRGEKIIRLLPGHAERVERLPDALERAHAVAPQLAHLVAQAFQPPRRRAAVLIKVLAERGEEPVVTTGQATMADALIEERGAQSDEHIVHQQVAIHPAERKHDVAMANQRTHRRGGVCRRSPHAIRAHLPQRGKRERLPARIVPRLDARFLEPREKAVDPVRTLHAGQRAAQPAHDPMPRLGDQAPPLHLAHVAARREQRIRLRHEPVQHAALAAAQRMLQHREPQLEPGGQPAHTRAGCGAEVALQHRVQFREKDPPARQFLAVTILREIRLASKDRRAAQQRLVEGIIFKRVQRVVVNENADRPLLRQQMRRVKNPLPESRLLRGQRRARRILGCGMLGAQNKFGLRRSPQTFGFRSEDFSARGVPALAGLYHSSWVSSMSTWPPVFS